jgi:hypothetical protein
MVYAGTVQIVHPGVNQTVPPGPIDVWGYWTAPGEPEPDPPSSITIQLDGGAAIEAQVTRYSQIGAHTWYGSFNSPQGDFNLAAGAHSVKVIATDDLGTRTEVTPFTAGAPPVAATLTGTSTVKSAMLLTSPDTVILTFTEPAPAAVQITSFPAITPAPVMTSGLTLTVTITMVSAGVGSFNPADGSITIPNVNLEVRASITGFGGFVNMHADATTQTTLTTGPSRSPAFNDSGEPLAASGAVTLVGDGVYSAPVFGMTDFGIVLAGIIAPHP